MRRNSIKQIPLSQWPAGWMLLDVSGRHKKTFPLKKTLTHSHAASVMSVMYSRLPARLQDGAVSCVYSLQIKSKKDTLHLVPRLSLNGLDSPMDPSVVIFLHSCVSPYHARVYHGALAFKHMLINPCQQSVCLQFPNTTALSITPTLLWSTTWWQIENSVQIFICRNSV